MKLAYIVSAYKLPEQLGRLVRRLAGPDVTFAVHVDRKSDSAIYDAMRRAVADVPGVHFLPRHRSFWAGFGHVRTTLKGIDHLIASGDPFDYAILLTGQDYPLVPPAAIAETLAASAGRSFMNWFPVPSSWWDGRGGLDRFERLHVVWRRSLHVPLPWRRRIPGGLAPYGGSAYWCLTRAAVEYVHRYVHAHPEYVRFFRTVYVPDELFFQTILLNSPLRSTIVDDDLRFLDWNRRPAPAVLGVQDLDAMLASGKLFARKFDVTVDGRVLDALDRHIELAAGRVGRP
jgi:hypothetical protein